MTIAATVARMIPIQFTFPPPRQLVSARDRYIVRPALGASPMGGSPKRLEQRHKHPYLARVRVIRRPEVRAKQALLGRGARVQRRIGDQQRPGDEQEVPRREARAGDVQRETRVNRMSDQPVGPGAHELVVAVELELEVVVPAEGEDRPDREADPRGGESQPGPAERLSQGELGAWPERDDQIRNEEEVRDVVRE